MGRRPLAAALLAVAAAAVACGGSERDPARVRAPARVVEPARPEAPAPLDAEIDVVANRFGAALRLEVRALVRGARVRAPFEDADSWRITARQGDRPIQRLTNGSTEVAREDVGGGRWDTVVAFDLTFELAGQGEVTVRLEPPGGKPSERTFDPAALADEGAAQGAGPSPGAEAAPPAATKPPATKAKKQRR